MTDRYIWHVTLQTGHTRQSWRHEISPELMPIITALLNTALADDGGVVLPGEPACRLIATAEGKCLVATVQAADDTPLVTFGVAAHARCGAGLWRCMTEIPTHLSPMPERPQAPWCAANLMHGLGVYPSAAHWLGDLERCIAWAWIEKP